MKIRGRVVYEDVEGGVWGIRDSSGRKYQPVGGIPTEFREKGCRVRAEIEPAELFSFTMWGRTVRILSIEKD